MKNVNLSFKSHDVSQLCDYCDRMFDTDSDSIIIIICCAVLMVLTTADLGKILDLIENI